MNDLLKTALANLAEIEKSAFVPMPGGQPPPPMQDPNAQPPQGGTSQGGAAAPQGGQPAPQSDPAQQPQPPSAQAPQPDPAQQQPAAQPPQEAIAQLTPIVQQIVQQTVQQMGIHPGQQDPTGFGDNPGSSELKSDHETTKSRVAKVEKDLHRLLSFLGIPTEDSYPVGGAPKMAAVQSLGFGMGAGQSAPLDPGTMQGMDAGLLVSEAGLEVEPNPVAVIADESVVKTAVTRASKFSKALKRK